MDEHHFSYIEKDKARIRAERVKLFRTWLAVAIVIALAFWLGKHF